MHRMRMLTLALSFVLGATALFAQNPDILTSDTVVLTLPLAPGEAPLEVTLAQMMAIYKEPGFNVAVIAHNRVAWAKGFGVTTAGGGTPVTPHTLRPGGGSSPAQHSLSGVEQPPDWREREHYHHKAARSVALGDIEEFL
jgi:CubicO group peptidase (beta-lactamase class C family)